MSRVAEKFKSFFSEGVAVDFDQSDITSRAIRLRIVDESGGICWELCRRWAVGVLSSTPQTPFDSKTFADRMLEIRYAELVKLVLKHNARSNPQVQANFDIETLSRVKNQDKKRTGIFWFSGLRDREAVIQHMYKNLGVYTFMFGTGGSGGHAVSFEVSKRIIRFFDPNLGLFDTPDAEGETKKKFLEWYSWLWGEPLFKVKEKPTSYKMVAHNGARKLVCYTKTG
jgi:hypothetical protein